MKRALLVLLLGVIPLAASADEGMWQPHQLSELAEELRDLGMRIDPAELADLTKHPMNAVISLGGCTASFVSPEGLVVTNYHCAYRAIQYNSTEEKNLLADGFLAGTPEEELFAGPGSRVLVTVAVSDVTGDVLGSLAEGLEGRARYQAIEDREKALIAACEEDEGHRCRVAAFHGGLEYYLIKQLEILRGTGRVEEAVLRIRQALELDPAAPVLTNVLTGLLDQLGRVEEAHAQRLTV